VKIGSNVELIDGTNAHVYVFKTGDEYVQVDAAMKGDARFVLSYYETNGIRPSRVLITHSHADHIGGLRVVYDLYRPEIYADLKEIPVIKGEMPPYSKSILMRVLNPFFRIRPVPTVNSTKDLSLPSVQVLQTPGHTPGSTTYILSEEGRKYAFVGDAAFEKNGRLFVNKSFSIDVPTAEKSLEKIRALAPITILPGHGAPLEIKREIKNRTGLTEGRRSPVMRLLISSHP